MICPSCLKTIPDDAQACPHCGAEPAPAPEGERGEPVFCDGCGARLMPSDRTCPKCGRPAPGILSTRSASSDLAAGRTASFPRLTPGMIAEAQVPASAPRILAESLDPEATNVLNADQLKAASAAGSDGADPAPKPSRPRRKARTRGSDPADDYHRPRRGRAVLAVLALILVAGGAWFVAADPMGVMPGFYADFQRSAREMFPSRQLPEGAAAQAGGSAQRGDGAGKDDAAGDEDATLTDKQAYARLSALYDDIVGFQDEIGPVVDDYNSWYMANSLERRKEGSKSAYAMRDRVQGVIDDLDALKLEKGSARTEDVEHLKQLAGWMYNRVDVLCRSWDISLSYTGDDLPSQHESEILQPLRDIEMEGGKAVDVIRYERYLSSWEPQE